MPRKKVLITGFEGFCGQHLAAILKKNDYSLIGTYHSHKPVKAGFPFYPLDITKAGQVYSLLKEIQPDYICHLAAQSNARLSWEKPDLTFQINVLGTLNLAKGILRHSPKTRLLYASSVQVYGRALRAGKAITEKCFLWPENPYAVSKAISEFNLLDLCARYGLDVIIVRANNLFGTGQSSDFVFGDWCRQIAEAEAGLRPAIIHVGNTKLKRDFLPVEDAMSAYEILLRKGKPGAVYNLSSKKSVALGKHLSFLVKNAKKPIRIQVQKNRFRKDDPPNVHINSAKLQKLGWKTSHRIDFHLQRVLEEWRNKVQE